jgi:hypothetical protein
VLNRKKELISVLVVGSGAAVPYKVSWSCGFGWTVRSVHLHSDHTLLFVGVDLSLA